MRRILTVAGCVLAVLAVFGTEAVRSQWTPLQDFPARVRSIYFLDAQGSPTIGFSGLQNGQIWRTADNGNSWSQCVTPGMYGVTQFCFKDATTGWCSVAASTVASGVWQTNDGGVTWTATSAKGLMVSVGYNQVSGILFATNWTASAIRSTDLGATWTSGFAPASQNGIAFSGSNGVVSVLTAPGFLYTTDGGLSWLSPPQQQRAECWSPLALTNGNTFYAVSESARQVLRSLDGGASWSSLYTFPAGVYPRGCITGTANALFIQTTNGFYSSLDQGLSWYSVCGPVNDVDIRFYSKGVEVFAGDHDGTLWHIADGTRGSVAALNLADNLRIVGSRCKSVDSQFRFSFRGSCGATLVRAQIRSGGEKFEVNAGPLPRSILRDDSVTVTYTTGSSQIDSAKLLLEFLSGPSTIDTIIPIYGSSRFVNSVGLDAPTSVTMLTSCGVLDTTVRVRNTSCDTLLLTGAAFNDSTNFVILAQGFPQRIAPGAFINLQISCTGTHAGQYSSLLGLHFQEAGNSALDTSLLLSLTILESAKPATPPLSLTVLSRCSIVDTSYLFINTQCDSIELTAANLTDNSVFQLTGLKLPMAIPSNGSVRLGLHVIPGSKGVDKCGLQLRYLSGTQQTDTAVALQLRVIQDESLRALLSSGSMGMGTVNAPCGRAQQTLYITNPLCATLKVVALDWVVPSTQLSLSQHNFPFLLSPNTRDSILVTFKPDRASTITAQLRLRLEVAGKQHDTLITVIGNGVSIYSDSILPAVFSSTPISICEPQHSSAEIINLSCTDVIALGAQFAGTNGYQVVNAHFPVSLVSQDTLHIDLALLPQHSGTVLDTLFVTMRNTMDGAQYIRGIPLRSLVSPAIHSVVLDRPTLTLDDLPPCSTIDTSVTIYNRGTCEDVTVSGLAFSGYPGLALDNASTLPRRIPPGDSARIGFFVAPSASQLAVSEMHIVGQNIDTTFHVTYGSRPGPSPVTVGVPDSVFVTRPCLRTSFTYAVVNASCDSFQIDEIGLAGIAGADQFGLDSLPTMPLHLAPGTSVKFLVSYDPNGNGDNASSLVVRSDQAKYIRAIPLRGVTKGVVPTVRLAVRAADSTLALRGKSGNEVTTKVLTLDVLPDSITLKTVSFQYHYNRDLLTITSLSAGEGWKLVGTSESLPGTLDVRLAYAGGTGSHSAELMRLRHLIAISSDSSCEVSISGVRFNSDSPEFERCTLASLAVTDPVQVNASPECGSGILRTFLQGSRSFQLLALTPNPVLGGAGIIRATTWSAHEGMVMVQVYDMLGRVAESLSLPIAAGNAELALDLSSLSPGNYVVSMSHDGVTREQRLAIENK